jgi:hypothetical protein
MLAMLRFLTSGEADASPGSAIGEERSGPPAVAYASAVLLGAGLAFALALAALAGLSRAEPARFGGIGSAAAASIVCPPAYAVAGARIFERDNLVLGIALVCAPEDSDGLPIESAILGVSTPQAALVRCPAEQAAVGIWGAAGALVDQLSLSCARRVRPRAPSEHLRGVGGSGGRGFHARCPGAMRGLAGTSGKELGQVALLCEEPDV